MVSTTKSGHPCVCEACTCGRHKGACKPEIHVDTHLDSETEYRKNYLAYGAHKRERGHAHPQQLTVGGDFYGLTENREKYHEHVIPKVYQHPKEVYHPNPAKLEGITTQKHDYPAWPGVKPPAQRPKAVYNGSTGKFESMTTHKNDYKDFGAQPRYHHPAPVYVKNEARFEGQSSNQADYRDWGSYQRPLGRVKQDFKSPSEERDFKTTNASDYVPHSVRANLVKPPPHMIPRDQKFDGTTTQKTDYQAWPVKAREQRRKQEYVPSPHHMDGHSVYHDSFGPKALEKVQSCAPKYQPLVTGKFEGISTHDADYQGYTGIKRREDFKPRLKYEAKSDDRDFMSVMKKDHNLKPLPHCLAADMLARPLENKEGHCYVKPL